MAPYQRVRVLRWLAVVAAAAAVASLLLPLHAGAQEGTDVSTQLKKVKATLADAKADANAKLGASSQMAGGSGSRQIVESVPTASTVPKMTSPRSACLNSRTSVLASGLPEASSLFHL